MRNYRLDETLLPKVWLTWLNKDGRIWANPNGKRQNHPEAWMYYDDERDINYWRNNGDRTPIGANYSTRNNDLLWIKAGSQLYYAYAKYHKDIDRLEIAAVKYDTTRGEHKHEWTFDGERFFIGRDKSIINQDGNLCRTFNIKRCYDAYDARNMISVMLRLSTSPCFIQEFKKFIGCNYFTIGNGTSVYIDHSWKLSKWYESTQKVRTKGKAQELTDKLATMPLSGIEHLTYKYRPQIIKDKWGYEKVINNFIYFERINDEWSVLRAITCNDNDALEETWRVYLSDDGINRIVSKSNNDWVPSSQPLSWSVRSSYYFANPDEAKEKCNRIKYILPIVEDDKTENVTKMIIALRFSEVEQLYQMGYEKFADCIVNSGTPKAEIKSIFGGYYNEKENGVLRRIGMTKYQLDKYRELCEKESRSYRYHNGKVLEKMREVFGNDLSYIDNATYDKYLEGFDVVLGNIWSMSRFDSLEVDKCRFWKNLIRLGEKNRNVYRLVNDTVSTYNRLNHGTEPIIDWIFDSYSDVVRIHDALTELKNEQDRELQAYWNMAEAERRRKDEEKRKETDEQRKCYEYEDEEFIIRLPKTVNEIVNEGTTQRICIGGYTTRHSKGETNLFFLRRKDDEDTPFYAIEMNNNKSIVQIHGFGNKWLGNNPEAIPTVIRWLRKNDIKCVDSILTCKAKGYGGCNDYVPMPVVD